MSNPATLATPPIQQPLLGQNGKLSVVWISWFNTLYLQAGGSSGSNIATLQSAITTLQTDVATLNTQLNLVKGWAQLEAVGPRL